MLVKRLSPGQRLLFIFIGTIVVPGLLLAVFGLRALWQERQQAEQHLQARLNDAADATVSALADRLERLQASMTGGLPPEKAFQNLPHDASWAFIERQGDALRIYPTRIIPYEISAPPTLRIDSALVDIAQLEAQEADPSLVIAGYQKLLSLSKPSSAAEIKHHLALTLRKTGKTDEATRLWKEIQIEGGRIGTLPADFVASLEMTSMDRSKAPQFCKDLAGGRWKIEKVRYAYYFENVCSSQDDSYSDADRLRLGEAVEAFVRNPSPLFDSSIGPYIAVRRENPFGALIMSPQFFAAQLSPRLPTAAGSDFEIRRITINGKELYSKPASQVAPTFSSTRSLDQPDLSWHIQVAPIDAVGFQAAMTRTTNAYLVILIGIVLLLGLGSYFIARTVRRELEVARMKSDFVSTVSHEFRSPLTGIRQLGEMLSRGRVSDENKRQQYFDLIVHESDRLTRLVENVLDFARMEDGRKQYAFEILDTSCWLNTVAEDFQQEALRTGHKLEACIPGQLPAVRGDREALSTALRNLLDNACKYSPQSETVWLNAEASNGGVRVQIRDHGVGISVREQSQIFEKFYRGGGELAKRVKGAGLGLSLVRHIVDSHHGEVHVESREGEGSTFSIHLSGAL